MTILVTGANGFVGQYLVKLLVDATEYNIIATGIGSSRLPLSNVRLQYHSLDITNGVAATEFYLKCKPDAVIHAAALTKPDYCELNKTRCWDANVTATRFLLDAVKKTNCYCIYLSTDFVFDGQKGMYIETDTTEPVNYYGSSKLAAEKAVIESGINFAIARTCLVYGNALQGSRSNIITWVKENLLQGKKIKVVNDQLRTPTYAEDFAKGILLMLEKKANGIFHISGEETMTPYDMAIATADYLQLDKTLIEKVDASVFTEPATRPLKTGFKIDKAKTILGYKPVSFSEGLNKMLSN